MVEANIFLYSNKWSIIMYSKSLSSPPPPPPLPSLSLSLSPLLYSPSLIISGLHIILE